MFLLLYGKNMMDFLANPIILAFEFVVKATETEIGLWKRED